MSHSWFTPDIAAPAYDITHYHAHVVTVNGGKKEHRRRLGLTVKFRQSKHLSEVHYIPSDNAGMRVTDEPNAGKPVTDFKDYFKNIEYANSLANQSPLGVYGCCDLFL